MNEVDVRSAEAGRPSVDSRVHSLGRPGKPLDPRIRDYYFFAPDRSEEACAEKFGRDVGRF
jgi:hypothetical protein